MSDVLRRNKGRIAKAIASELGEESLTEDGLEPVDMKNIYQAGQTAAFEKAKPTLDQVLTACKEMLEKGISDDEVRPLILEMVQSVDVNHRYTKIGDNYSVLRRNNGQAADRIMQCLRDGESIDQVLKCVYAEVYYLMNPDEDPADPGSGKADDVPPPSGADGTPADDATGHDSPLPAAADPAPDEGAVDSEEDLISQLKPYLSYLAGEFAGKVEEIIVDDETVLVPRPEYVRLRQARSNGVWLLSYDSIFGEAHNPWRGSDPDKYQAKFDVRVHDQELAAATNPDDMSAMKQLILESVPRHQASKDEPGKPKNYFLMTREDNDDLKIDIADLLGLPHNSPLLGWLRSELIKGADADTLIDLLADQQRQWAMQDAQPKEDLKQLRPLRPVAETSPAPEPETNDSDARERTIRSIRAFIRSEIEGLSREEAVERKDDILAKAKALL